MSQKNNTLLKFKNLLREKLLLVAGGFLIVFIAIIFIIFLARYQPQKKTDTIIESTPAETVAYTHFYLTGANETETKIVNAVFDKLDDWPEFKELKLKENLLPILSQEFTIALLPGEEEKLTPILFAKVITAPNLDSKNYFAMAEPNLIAITDSKIREKYFAPDNKNNFVAREKFNLNNYFPVENSHFNQNFVQIDSLLKNYDLKNQENVSMEKLMLEFIKKNDFKKALIKSVATANGLLFNLITSPSLLPEPETAATGQPIIKNLDNNFLLYFRGNPNQETIELLEQLILNGSYKDTGTVLTPLLDNKNLEALVKQEETKLVYLLAWPIDSVSADKINETKLAASQYLTDELPEEQGKVLPDKTKVIEIVSNPEKFNFQKIYLTSDATAELYFLDTPEINQQIIIGIDQNKIVLSNSKKIIDEYLDNQSTERTISIGNTLKNCLLDNNSSQLLLVNLRKEPEFGNFLFNFSNLFDLFAIESGRNAINGCLK